MKKSIIAIAVSILLISLLQLPVFAGDEATYPNLIRFQGKLRSLEGLPLNGMYSLAFALYDIDVDADPLWREVQEDINIEDGLLDVELGSMTTLDLPFDKQYWLGVEVESDGEMTPRFKLTSVPYSFVSGK